MTTIGHLPALPKRFSLVAQTAQSLREAIHSGCWQAYLPGERELAAQLQVGRNTLRAALQELERTGWLHSEHGRTRRICRQANDRDHLVTSKRVAILSARSLLTLPAPIALILDAVRDRLTRSGCAVSFHESPPCFAARPAAALERVVGRHPSATWLVFGSQEPMQRWFIRRHIPCFIVGSCADSIALPSIDADHRAACRHAANALLRKGHRRMALVLPQGGYGGDRDSEQALREALAVRADATLRVIRHDGSQPHLCALLDEVITTRQPPTAYVVARAAHVLTVMTHLMRRGLRIPQDVAIIARDDDPCLQALSPSVCRYAIDPAQAARRVSLAIRQLVETGTLPPRALRILPRFIAGETV